MTQAINPTDPTLADILAELKKLDVKIETSRSELETSRLELKAEVKRWDDRFFKFAEDTANRSNTLIAGAAVSVIAGVILLLIRS